MGTYSARPSQNGSRRRSQPIKKPAKRCPPTTHPRFNRKAGPTSRAINSITSPYQFVYVGNLRSDVQDKHLKELFAPSGKITKVEIRCCSGIAVPSDSNECTFYATVLFATVAGATQALAMNGNLLLGNKIVVSTSFLGLPEANRGIRPQPVEIFGINVTAISDTVLRVVDNIRTGGTQVI
ncbi:hypothetical protein BJV74DRAFT_814566 [Russula compacta]|nr:hypothetical protein BJV74DRAFT_814566 [Russula compacta]